MKLIRPPTLCLPVCAILAFAAADTSRAGDVLATPDRSTVKQWYGRAGGLVGAARIDVINQTRFGTGRIRLRYEQDQAQQTNMPGQGLLNGHVSITYDKDVVQRTNMRRDGRTDSLRTISMSAKGAN